MSLFKGKKTPGLLLAFSALFLLLLPLSALGVRFGVLAVKVGLLVLAIAVVVNSLLGLVSLFCVLKYRFRPIYLGSLAFTLPALVLLMTGIHSIVNHPIIHHVSTDTEPPPEFVVAPEKRGNNSNPLEYTAETAATQRQAYPDLVSIPSSLAPEQAFDRALATARDLGWQVYAAEPAEGRIEAVDTTFWFGFKDDIAIRVEPMPGGGSLIDLRSISRIGGGDAGTNARRIRRFREHFITAPAD